MERSLFPLHSKKLEPPTGQPWSTDPISRTNGRRSTRSPATRCESHRRDARERTGCHERNAPLSGALSPRTRGCPKMTNWNKDDLRKIAEADDLHISPFREDGVTYGTPTWIWSVAVGDGLYVRAYNGQKSRWYQAATRHKAGRIIAAGMTKEVAFELVEGPINDLIDEAY